MVKVTDMVRGYESAADRQRAVKQLSKMGYNYFVGFRDVQSPFALQVGKVDWVRHGRIHVKDVY